MELCEECDVPLEESPHHLHCDLCNDVEHSDDLTPDWNGETGNHLSCEASNALSTMDDTNNSG